MNLNAKDTKQAQRSQSIECIALCVLGENTLCSLCLKNMVFRDALLSFRTCPKDSFGDAESNSIRNIDSRWSLSRFKQGGKDKKSKDDFKKRNRLFFVFAIIGVSF